MYAQRNYLETQGINGKYGIYEIGCLLTAHSNLLKRAGVEVNPLQLNAFYVANNKYIDIDDGIRDDLDYNTVSSYNADVVFLGRQLGVPQNNDAIVKFRYKGRSGFNTHFALLHDFEKGLIVDSYDGQIKHWSVYGGAVEFGIFRIVKPVPTPHVAPYTPLPPAPITGSWVHLPPVVDTWAVYKVGSQLRKGTSDQVGNLSPRKYDLRYKIVERIGDYGVIIDTQAFGRVAVWTKNTSAVFYDEAIKAPVVVPAPPAPVVTTPVPAPVEKPTEAVVVHTPVTPVKEDTNAQVIHTPAVQDLSWQDSETGRGAGSYDSEEAYEVTDLSGHFKEKIALPAGQLVRIFGTFHKDGKTYYRPSLKSHGIGHWYGIPAKVLGAEELVEEKRSSDDDKALDLDLARELKKFLRGLSSREQIIDMWADIQEAFDSALRKKKKK